MLEKGVHIPTEKYLINQPPPLYIEIVPKGNYYEGSCRIGLNKDKWEIKMTEQDLDSENKKLRCVMERANDWSSASLDEKEKIKRELAEMGKYLFMIVFPVKTVRDALLDCLNNNPDILISVNTDKFNFPWDLLYSEEITIKNKPCLDKLWGFKHIIYHETMLNSLGQKGNLELSSFPKLNLISYRELEYVQKKEIPYLEKLALKKKIKLNHLEPLSGNEKKYNESIEKFKKFYGQRCDIIHFSCHANQKEDNTEEDLFVLSKKFDLTLRALKLYEMKNNWYPLIILNACRTGRVSPLHALDFVQQFIENGTCGVLATECTIDDACAAEFTEHFYNYFILERLPIGRSLIETRRHLLCAHDNPIGLFYTLYAIPLIKISHEKRINK